MSGEHAPEDHFGKLERTYDRAAINRYFQPTPRVSEGRAEVVIPVRPDFFHAARLRYTVCSTRPMSEGKVRAVGRVVHASRNRFLAEAGLVDHVSRQVGRGSGSFMRSAIPLSADLGYA